MQRYNSDTIQLARRLRGRSIALEINKIKREELLSQFRAIGAPTAKGALIFS
jgi:hypothetical protein